MRERKFKKESVIFGIPVKNQLRMNVSQSQKNQQSD